MKKQSWRILMALLGLAVLGATPKAAQVVDQIDMTVPFEFVISDKTLPAGTYRVNRVWNDNLEALVITNTENNASATVLPTEVESSAAKKPQVSFETAGGEHFLSKIETANHIFTIPVSRATLLLASGKSHSGAASGSSDGNN
jgi:hypothetical protein